MPAIRQRNIPALQSNIHRRNTGEITRSKTLQCERKNRENDRKISPKPQLPQLPRRFINDLFKAQFKAPSLDSGRWAWLATSARVPPAVIVPISK